MSVKTITVKTVSWKDLSEAIREDLDDGSRIPIFWVKAPKSIESLQAFPFWAEYCKSEDIKAGEQILIQGRK